MMDWSIHPNPSSLTIQIQGFEKMKHTFTISILDSKGILVNVSSGESDLIDVSNLENGLYFIHVETEKGNTTKRFIKN
jgi:hypothetical protein